MVLMLMSSGSAVIGGEDGLTGVGLLGISFAFGLSVAAMTYAISPISGSHINPAISVAMVAVGIMKMSEAPLYIAAQIIGVLLGEGIFLM